MATPWLAQALALWPEAAAPEAEARPPILLVILNMSFFKAAEARPRPQAILLLNNPNIRLDMDRGPQDPLSRGLSLQCLVTASLRALNLRPRAFTEVTRPQVFQGILQDIDPAGATANTTLALVTREVRDRSQATIRGHFHMEASL